MGSKHKTIFLLAIGIISLLIIHKLFIMDQEPRKDNSAFLNRYFPFVGYRNEATCPDYVTGVAKGRWVTRPLTSGEQIAIDTYLKDERGTYRIPPTYQRHDGRCGDVPYEQSPLYRHMWFKAICNPNGATPCCHTNACVALSKDECRCPTCYDERQSIHAEYSTWLPDDVRCPVKTFTSQDACRLLNGSALYFVGDSFIRHVFAAMVIVLSNNTVDGALRSDVEHYIKERCTGMHQITGVTCRELLDENRTLCHGTVTVRYVQVFPSQDLPLTAPLLHSLRHVNKSIVIMAIGIHDDFNFNVVNHKFLLPFLNMRQHLSTSKDNVLDLNNVLTNFGNQSSETRLGDHKKTTVSKHLEYLIPRDMEGMLRDKGSNYNSLWNFPEIFGKQNNFINNSESLFNRFGDVLGKSLAKHNNSEYLLSFLLRLTGKNPIFSANGSQQVANFPLSRQPSRRLLSNFGVPLDNQRHAGVDALPTTSSRVSIDTEENIVFEKLPRQGLSVDKLWPRLLWIGAHAPGLMKSPKFKRQTADGVQEFNLEIQRVLQQWRVPYLDTFSLTNGTVSFDGTHYGWGINMMKVNMILTYMEAELVQGWDWR